MKTLIALAFAAATLAAAHAQTWTQNQIGPYTYFQGITPSGQPFNGTSNQIGPYTYFQGTTPQGSVNCTSNRIGMYTYTNCN